MAAIRCQEVYRITYEATAGSGRRWVDRKGDKDEATAGATRGNARQRQATPGNARQRGAARSPIGLPCHPPSLRKCSGSPRATQVPPAWPFEPTVDPMCHHCRWWPRGGDERPISTPQCHTITRCIFATLRAVLRRRRGGGGSHMGSSATLP